MNRLDVTEKIIAARVGLSKEWVQKQDRDSWRGRLLGAALLAVLPCRVCV